MSRNVLVAQGLQHEIRLPTGQVLRLLEGVDLVIRASEIVAITGRSGSGKTTLLAALGLLTRVAHGNITINDQPVNALPDRQRARLRNRRLGFVFQSYSLIRHLSASANVELALRYGAHVTRRERRNRVAETLELVGLGDRARSKPRQLSGGEQQRVAIARALVRQPDLILADEPTGALDLETAESLLDVFTAACRDRGCALVIVTHDSQVANRADRILDLADGRLSRATP